MSPEEINKKAYEKYPVKTGLWFDSHGIPEEIDLNEEARNAYIEAYKEISSIPTIKGWVARDENGRLCLYCKHPEKGDTFWIPKSGRYMSLDQSLFPDLKWPAPPSEVELPMIRK